MSKPDIIAPPLYGLPRTVINIAFHWPYPSVQ